MMRTAKPHRFLDLRSWAHWTDTRSAGWTAAVDFA